MNLMLFIDLSTRLLRSQNILFKNFYNKRALLLGELFQSALLSLFPEQVQFPYQQVFNDFFLNVLKIFIII